MFNKDFGGSIIPLLSFKFLASEAFKGAHPPPEKAHAQNYQTSNSIIKHYQINIFIIIKNPHIAIYIYIK